MFKIQTVPEKSQPIVKSLHWSVEQLLNYLIRQEHNSPLRDSYVYPLYELLLKQYDSCN